MVEAVKNSTQIKNLPAHNVPHGVNSGAGQVANAGNDALFNQGLTSSFSDFSDLGNLGSNGLDTSYFDDLSTNLSIYGSMALNPRVFKAYQQETMQAGYDFENQSITEDDQNNLEPLSERMDEYRIFGIRAHHRAEVTENLEEAKESGKGVALYLTNCAKDGLKDPNQPISFENLKNPLKLVNTLKSHSFNTPDANKNIDLLSDIAIKERSPQLAAALLEATSKGGITGIGVDSKTAEKLLIESKSKFDNEGDYYKYITNVNKAYKNMSGKTLDKYIDNNYKPALQKTAPASGVAIGAAIGLACGSVPGAAIGAVVGGLVGLATYASNWFGKNEEGQKLLSAVDKARNKSHDVNVKKYSSDYTFGDNTLGLALN